MPSATSPAPAPLPQIPELTPRRRQLLDAAVTVVGTSGLRGLTHRAVDREAGVPEGTSSVSYRTRLALLTALTEYIGDQLAAEVSALAQALPEQPEGAAVDPEPVVTAATELLTAWVAEPHRLICIVELTLETVRTPGLRTSFVPWRERLVDIVESVAERKLRSRGRLQAQAAVASLEGVLTSALSQEPERRQAYVTETVPMVLHGMVDLTPAGGR